MQAHQTAAVRRVALVGPDAASLVRLRGGLIRELVAARHSVLCLAPDLAGPALAAIEELGAKGASYYLLGDGPQLLADKRSVGGLVEHLAPWRPHAVLGYGGKSMALAALASAKLGETRSVSLVSALGAALPAGDGVPGWSWRRLLKSAFKATGVAVFHNAWDQRRLTAAGLLPEGIETHLLAGGGVDLALFTATPLPPLADGLTFVMVSALDQAKGIAELMAASAIIKSKAPTARVIHVGPDGRSTGAVPRNRLAAAGIEVAGDQADVRPWLARAHVLVQPSHAEGMSRTLLEALAAGRPVIASNIPGCREAVDERVNGILVPSGDAAALAGAMESLLKRPDLIPAMARASRMKAERRFDARTVNRELIAILRLE